MLRLLKRVDLILVLYQLLLLVRAQKQLVSVHSVTLLVQNMSVQMILPLDMVVQYVMEIYGMIHQQNLKLPLLTLWKQINSSKTPLH